MASGTFVGWTNLINALGIGLLAMVLTVLGTVYTGLLIPESLTLVIGLVVGGVYLLEAEWDLSSRLTSTH